METARDIETLIDELIEREGGYVNHPADRGGPTRFGITEAVARAHGYARRHGRAAARRSGGDLPPALLAAAAVRRSRRAPARLAAELFDTGANMGPAVAATFLQRALTALNRNGKDYPDLVPDGRIGPRTLAALDAFLSRAGRAGEDRAAARASRRCRASAICAWPSGGRPMRRSSTAGWRTGLVS